MSGSDSDAEAFSAPRQRSSRTQSTGKGKKPSSNDPNSASKATKNAPKNSNRPRDPESTEDSDSAPEPAKTSTRKTIKVEDPESTASDSSAFEPARKTTRQKVKTEDPESTDSDSSVDEPQRSSTKKRKAETSESEASDAKPSSKKKITVKRESPESTESGTPSPSPPRDQSPDEVLEPEVKQDDGSTENTDESTESPDESDSDEDKVDQPIRPNSNLPANLPPSINNMRDDGFWIHVKNPHYKGSKEPNPAVFWATAEMDLLGGQLYRPRGRGSTKIDYPTKRLMESEILNLARREGVMAGKWMFFLPPGRIDYYWNVIAQATERGELGPSAKVATDDGSGKARLLAVYTCNFDDVADVRRVAQKLVDLGLISPKDRPIYYKTDAYTYLEINYDNPWGLKASMYNSRDILARRF